MNVTSYAVIPVVPAASASASSELAVSREVIFMQELTMTMTMQTKLLSTVMANGSGPLTVSYNMRCYFQFSRYIGCQPPDILQQFN